LVSTKSTKGQWGSETCCRTSWIRNTCDSASRYDRQSFETRQKENVQGFGVMTCRNLCPVIALYHDPVLKSNGDKRKF
jgi:hypothetical protein